jgi:hypothetical protein
LAFVLEIVTDLSAASEFITCSTATGGAIETLWTVFISEADVDEGVEGRQSASETTSLLSNLHAERET